MSRRRKASGATLGVVSLSSCLGSRVFRNPDSNSHDGPERTGAERSLCGLETNMGATETAANSGEKPSMDRERLQRWLDANGWTSADLERRIEPPIARQTMGKIRDGSDVRLSTMRRIQRGACRLAGRPVRMEELWDIDPPHDESNRT
jgi:hypothetical protein